MGTYTSKVSLPTRGAERFSHRRLTILGKPGDPTKAIEGIKARLSTEEPVRNGNTIRFDTVTEGKEILARLSTLGIGMEGSMTETEIPGQISVSISFA
ncbi:MAG: hypothetical protein WCT39_00185 [Candidatus Margulisiibacteriota bacterium]